MRYFLLFSYTKERREEKVSDWWDHTNSTRLYFCARTVSLLYSQFFKCKFQNLLPAILFQKNEEWCWFGATAQALERLYIKNSAVEHCRTFTPTESGQVSSRVVCAPFRKLFTTKYAVRNYTKHWEKSRRTYSWLLPSVGDTNLITPTSIVLRFWDDDILSAVVKAVNNAA